MQLDDIRILLSIIVSIISIISFIIRFIVRNKSKCMPTYTLMTKTFIPSECGKINDLKVTYKDMEIERFTITTFVFWNNGKEKLLKRDYGKTAPHLSSDNFTILDYSILDINDDNFINLKEDFYDNKLFFNFDTISQNQGFVVNVLHTGNTNKDITFNFNFNNVKCKRIMLFNKKRTDIFSKLGITMFWLLGVLIIGLLTISGIVSHTKFEDMFLFLSSFILVTVGTIINIRESYIPYFGVPKRFQKYFDEINY